MPKANPKAWFPNQYVARAISYRPVDKWARSNEKFKPFFPTWTDAHDWLLAKAVERLKKAQAELKSATAHHAKVKAMQEPQAVEAGEDQAA